MLEDGVGDVFARVFGGSILPQEVEALLRREAADGVQKLAGERYLAPNDYLITLSPEDFQRFSADQDFTETAFARHLGGYLQEQGWQTYGEVVVRFEQSDGLHTGQYRARAVVNPDADPRPSPHAPVRGQLTDAYTAEPGAPAMTDNPSYRAGQGRPGDEYPDEQYGRPQEESRAGAQEPPRAPYQPDQGYAANYEQQGHHSRPAYPEQGGYPDQGYGQNHGSQDYAQAGPGFGPSYGQPVQGYDRRPPAGGYGAPGYEQGYRQAPGGYPPPGSQYGPPPGSGYAPPAPPAGDYDYGRQAPGRYDEPGYGRHEPRPAYPDQQGYQPGYGGGYGQPDHGYRDYGQPDYSQRDYGQQPGYPAPAGDYDYGQQAPAQGGGYPQQGGYAPPAGGDYPSAGHSIVLQLDDGSGRTYQLREGANVIGRGQDAQFRLPDTGVSRRHLEIRWDGQVALLSDLNSTNGTTVNNAPVQEWQLADGDVIRLGHSEIIVHVR